MTANGPLQDGMLKRGVGLRRRRRVRLAGRPPTVGAALGGLDIAMPELENPWGAALVAAVRDGAVPEEVSTRRSAGCCCWRSRVGALDGVARR